MGRRRRRRTRPINSQECRKNLLATKGSKYTKGFSCAGSWGFLEVLINNCQLKIVNWQLPGPGEFALRGQKLMLPCEFEEAGEAVAGGGGDFVA